MSSLFSRWGEIYKGCERGREIIKDIKTRGERDGGGRKTKREVAREVERRTRQAGSWRISRSRDNE